MNPSEEIDSGAASGPESLYRQSDQPVRSTGADYD
jgi:hypothetical protein